MSHYLLWSDYKHHTNINILVCITPNGAISWVSLAYGGRASDAYIVRNSAFLDLLEFYDQMMTDKGFKIKTDLALKQCTLAIPPSASSGCQMISRDVKETSIAENVQIYVEQAIKNIKDYRILKIGIRLKYLSIADNVCVCLFPSTVEASPG